MVNLSDSNSLFFFGGEYFNGFFVQFYNDLSIYNINCDEWCLVMLLNVLLLRLGYFWMRVGNLNYVYLFGGEFLFLKQGIFYYYFDFWRLEFVIREWIKIEVKGKDKSLLVRSGYCMIYWKQYIIFFGGF